MFPFANQLVHYGIIGHAPFSCAWIWNREQPGFILAWKKDGQFTARQVGCRRGAFQE
jgi:hypothetical protein